MTAKVVSAGIVAVHDAEDCWLPGPLSFRLIEPLEVEIDGVRYRAPAGATTDGASTPRAFRNLVPRIGRHLYGAIIHDAAYRGRLEMAASGTEGRDEGPFWVPAKPAREWADHAFLALMVATNTGWLTRNMAYYAVRLFGRWAYRGRD